jgi:hypothetical protein
MPQVKIDNILVITTKRLKPLRIPKLLKRWSLSETKPRILEFKDYSELGIDEKIKDRKFYNSRLKDPIRKMKEYSLYLNQLETLSIIIEEKLENVLILEDDALPEPDFYLLKIKYPEDCDLLYLGGFFGKPSKKIISLNPPNMNMVIRIPNSKNCYGVKYYCAHAMFYPNYKCAKKVLDILKKYKPKPFDCLMANYIHPKCKCYCCLPSLIIQDSCSDLNPNKYITPMS